MCLKTLKGEVKMHTNSNRLYAETPPLKLFFTAAIPGVIGMFAMSIYWAVLLLLRHFLY